MIFIKLRNRAPRWRTGVRPAILGGLVFLGAASAQAQETTDPAELQDLLRQRDAVISDLLRRVETLERGWNELPEALTAPEAQDDGADAGAEPAPETNGAAEPGRLVVDPKDAERALERTLTTTGALLLPPGTVEVSPSLSYTRDEDSAAVFIDVEGGRSVATQKLRRDIVDAGLDIQVGLPLDSQLELSLPYTYVDQSNVTFLSFGAEASDEDYGFGPSDITVGLAKTLLREQGWRPDLIGRVTWDTASGEGFDNGVGLGGGSNEVSVGLTALKRQDPLVFAGSVFYERSFEDDDFRSGDAFTYSLSTFLAVSPETSLRVGFSQTFAGEDEFDNDTIDGSDTNAVSLNLGASVLLGTQTLLDVSGGIGVTDDASDYSIGVSLPIRFDLPIP